MKNENGEYIWKKRNERDFSTEIRYSDRGWLVQTSVTTEGKSHDGDFRFSRKSPGVRPFPACFYERLGFRNNFVNDHCVTTRLLSSSVHNLWLVIIIVYYTSRWSFQSQSSAEGSISFIAISSNIRFLIIYYILLM